MHTFVYRELRKAEWKVIRVWEHEWKEPPMVIAKLRKHSKDQLGNLIKQVRQQAKKAGLKPKDIKSAITKARSSS